MAEVVVFHHALGLTPGVESFASFLREAGHVVHVPDLYEGSTFTDLDEGVGFARTTGFDVIGSRAAAAAEALPEEVYYLGMSLGVMPAQELAQNRPGARGAILLYSAAPAGEFGGWPDGVALQIHIMENDPWEDTPIARALAAEVPGSELYVYPGDRHLFADESSEEHDPEAAALVRERVLAFLG